MATEFPPFSIEAARQMLRWGFDPEASPFTHKQIAEWCDRFWCSYSDTDAPAEIEKALPVLADVDVQWDLFLSNTYTFEQLRTINLDQVRLPSKWFSSWASQLGA